MSPKRPLVETTVRAHLGEVQESSEFQNTQDFTFIPGYSDKRRQADIARREGHKGPVLTHRFQFVRVKNALGGPDGRAIASWRALGYHEVHTDDLPGLGIEMPTGGAATPEGFIDVGDVRLYVCDAKRAAQNEKNWRRATDEMQATDRAPALEAEGRKIARPGEDLTFAEGAYSSPEPDA